MPRIIYSLQLELEEPKSTRGTIGLIAPLDPPGQSPHCRACSPKRRVIDLRVGDFVEHKKSRRYRIVGIKAYRDAWMGTPPESGDGYVVRES